VKDDHPRLRTRRHPHVGGIKEMGSGNHFGEMALPRNHPDRDRVDRGVSAPVVLLKIARGPFAAVYTSLPRLTRFSEVWKARLGNARAEVRRRVAGSLPSACRPDPRERIGARASFGAPDPSVRVSSYVQATGPRRSALAGRPARGPSRIQGPTGANTFYK
jgi:hypothetical protein